MREAGAGEARSPSIPRRFVGEAAEREDEAGGFGEEAAVGRPDGAKGLGRTGDGGGKDC